MSEEENPSEVFRLIAFLDARVRKFLTEDPHNLAAARKLWMLGVDDFSLFVDLCPLFHGGAPYEQRLLESDIAFLEELHISKE